MLKLTKKMEISLIIFKHIKLKSKKKDTPTMVTTRDIAFKYRISENFVAKIMQKLCKEEILASKQGIQGGYYLNKNLNQLTFLDLVEKVENNFGVVHCVSDDHCIYQSDCTIIPSMKKLNQKFKDFYQSVKLDELIDIPFTRKNEERTQADKIIKKESKVLNKAT